MNKAPEKKEPPKDNKKKEVKKKDFKITDVIMDSEPQPKINDGSFGVSNFLLSEMLKPHIRTLKLRAPLVPNKKFEVFFVKLDLNFHFRIMKLII